MVEDMDRVGERYAMTVLFEDYRPTPGVLGIGDVVRFVTGGHPSLTPDQTRYLFSKPSLRRAYTELKRDLSVVRMPEVAAASDGELDERDFVGGALKISQSSQPGQVKVTVTLEESKRGHRVNLILEHPSGGAERLDFTFPPNEDGKISEMLDTGDPRSARVVAMLRDADVKGEFVRYEPPGP